MVKGLAIDWIAIVTLARDALKLQTRYQLKNILFPFIVRDMVASGIS